MKIKKNNKIYSYVAVVFLSIITISLFLVLISLYFAKLVSNNENILYFFDTKLFDTVFFQNIIGYISLIIGLPITILVSMIAMVLAYLAYKIGIRDERREAQKIIKDKSEEVLEKFFNLALSINKLGIFGTEFVKKINKVQNHYFYTYNIFKGKYIGNSLDEDGDERIIDQYFTDLKTILLDYHAIAKDILTESLLGLHANTIGLDIISNSGKISIGGIFYSPTTLFYNFLWNGDNKILEMNNMDVIHIFDLLDKLACDNIIYKNDSHDKFSYLIQSHKEMYTSIILISLIFPTYTEYRDVHESDYKFLCKRSINQSAIKYGEEPLDWTQIRDQYESSDCLFKSIDNIIIGPIVVYWLFNLFLDSDEFKKYVFGKFELNVFGHAFDDIVISSKPKDMIILDLWRQIDYIKSALDIKTETNDDNLKIIYASNECLLRYFKDIQKHL